MMKNLKGAKSVLLKLSDKELNELYLNKTVALGEKLGTIIHVCYYSNLDNVPYAEVKLEDQEEDIKILPLAKLVLVVAA